MAHTRRYIDAGWPAVGLVLAVCLFRIPVPDDQGRALMRVLLEVGVGVVFAGVVARRVSVWAGAFVAMSIFAWLIAFRISDPTAQRIAYLARDGVLFGAGALVLFREAARDHRGLVMDAMIAVACANLVAIAMQSVGVDPYAVFSLGLMESSWIHPVGLMTNKNETSCLFAMAAFACMRERRAVFLPAMLAGLVLARSTGGVLALAAGAVFWWWAAGLRLSSLFWWVACPGIMYVILFDPEVSIAFTERFRIWGLGDIGLTHRPFLGVGPGLWPLATGQLHAHNEFLQAWFEFGYLAPVILAGYAVSVWQRYRPAAAVATAAVIAAAVNCSVSFPMHIAPTALMILAWVGILEADLA